MQFVADGNSQIFIILLSDGALFTMNNLLLREICKIDPSHGNVNILLKQSKLYSSRLSVEDYPLKSMVVLDLVKDGILFLFIVSQTLCTASFHLKCSDGIEITKVSVPMPYLVDYHFFDSKSSVGLFITANNDLQILNTVSGKTLCSVHIGESVNSVITVQKQLSDAMNCFQVVLRTSKNDQHYLSLQTVIEVNDEWFILPHGQEQTKLDVDLICKCVTPCNKSYIVQVDDCQLTFHQVSGPWSSFLEEIKNELFRTNFNAHDQFISFGSFVGMNLACSYFRASKECSLSLETWRQQINCLGKRRFPAELIQAAALLLELNWLSLRNQCSNEILQQFFDIVQDQLNSQHMLDIGLFDCQIIVRRWKYYSAVAKQLALSVDLFPHSQPQICDVMINILPGSIGKFCTSSIVDGNLKAVLFLRKKQIPFHIRKPLLSLLRELPKYPEIDSNDLVSTVEMLHQMQQRTIVSKSDALLDQTQFVLDLGNALYERCQFYVGIQSENPVDVLRNAEKNLVIIQFVLNLLNSVSIDEIDDKEIKRKFAEVSKLNNQLRTMKKNLQIQIIFEKLFSVHIEYHEILRVGYEGLIFERIDSLPEDTLLEALLTKIPKLLEIAEMKFDSVLMQWIEDTLTSCVIYGAPSVDGDNNTCSFTRLLLVAFCLVSFEKKAKAALLFFQIPSLEEICSAQSVELNFLLTKFTSNHRKIDSRGINEIGKVLCEFAETVIAAVELDIKEQLIEAVRLFRMKQIALFYKITNFQLKDFEHLIGSASLILNCKNTVTNVDDSLQFAIDRGLVRIDIRTSLVRYITEIIESTDSTLFDNATDLIETSSSPDSCDTLFKGLENDLQLLLSVVPSKLLSFVVEDCIVHCFESINALSQKYFDLSKNKINSVGGDISSIDKEKVLLMQLTKGSIKLMEISLDSNHNDVPSSNCRFLEERTSVSTVDSNSMCSLELLHDLKRMLLLQYHYGVYIPLHDLRRENVKKKLIESLSIDLVSTWMKSTAVNSKVSQSDISVETISQEVTALTMECNKLKRISGLLRVVPQHYILSVMKQLIHFGKKV